jgi:hypothetical protein
MLEARLPSVNQVLPRRFIHRVEKADPLCTARRALRQRSQLEAEHRTIRVNRVLMAKALIASAAMIVLFFAGLPVPKVALTPGRSCCSLAA